MQFTVYDANEESKRIKLGEAFDTENNFSIRSLFVIFYSNYIHAMWKHFQWTEATLHRIYRSELYEIVNCVVNLCHTFQWFVPLSFLLISLFYDLSIAKVEKFRAHFILLLCEHTSFHSFTRLAIENSTWYSMLCWLGNICMLSHIEDLFS